MYQYKYVELEVYGFLASNRDGEHRPIINQYAEEGWRYVGWMPLTYVDHGAISKVDLIFERPVEDEA